MRRILATAATTVVVSGAFIGLATAPSAANCLGPEISYEPVTVDRGADEIFMPARFGPDDTGVEAVPAGTEPTAGEGAGAEPFPGPAVGTRGAYRWVVLFVAVVAGWLVLTVAFAALHKRRRGTRR